jgi:uncharacterized membrane protein
MAVNTTFLLAILAMALASYSCRLTGYLLMGYVPVTGRVQAALKAIPLGVMIGIVMPSVVGGKLPEMVGLAVVFVAMRLTGKDVIVAIAGAATVGICRWAGL